MGGKKDPVWRVVVADSRSPRDGRSLEVVGRYNAQTEPSEIVLDRDRLQYWLDRGAQPSHTVVRSPRGWVDLGRADARVWVGPPGDAPAGSVTVDGGGLAVVWRLETTRPAWADF